MVPRSPEESSLDIGPHSRVRVIHEMCSLCHNTNSAWFSMDSQWLCDLCFLHTCCDADFRHFELWEKATVTSDCGSYLRWEPISHERPPTPPPPQKEYWYWLCWTHNDEHTINDTWKNMLKFRERDLGFIVCEFVHETGSKSKRHHFHMRMKLKRPLKKQKIHHYEKVGSIDFKVIRVHTKANWENLEGYMSKESEIEDLMKTEKTDFWNWLI